MANTHHKGSCLCGKVTYEVDGDLRDIIGCHCQQCRKTTGHMMAATAASLDDFTITRDDGLQWYRSSDTAQRGFCRTCGSSLFWRADGKDYVAICAGTLDTPTGLKVAGHIFCADKGIITRSSMGHIARMGLAGIELPSTRHPDESRDPELSGTAGETSPGPRLSSG